MQILKRIILNILATIMLIILLYAVVKVGFFSGNYEGQLEEAWDNRDIYFSE